jgi:ABC-2 type transport system permease protein
MIVNEVHVLATLPLVLLVFAEVYLFALGVSLILATSYVKYRDVVYIWEVALQAGFYLTPILYPLSKITNLTFQKLILLNPMAQTIQDARYVAITHDTTTAYKLFEGGWYALIPFVLVAVVLAAGLLYFRKEANYFAENI